MKTVKEFSRSANITSSHVILNPQNVYMQVCTPIMHASMINAAYTAVHVQRVMHMFIQSRHITYLQKNYARRLYCFQPIFMNFLSICKTNQVLL